MTIATSPNTMRASLNIRYASLAALQAAHNGLLQRQRQEGDAPEFVVEVGSFLREGAATGALIYTDADRRTAQGLLDYWVARLYRVTEEPPDATLAEFDLALVPDLPDELCPYLGLDAFHESDGDKFFGRNELIARLVKHMTDQRLLAVVGPSGSGKSSLVRAGLIPALKRGALHGSENWIYLPTIVPGSDPLAALSHVLPGKSSGCQELQEASFLPISVSPCLLVVDQFEELFTLCGDDQARQAFVAVLREFIESPDAEHRLILTMRSDFETFIARAPDLQARFNQDRVQVTPLSAAELREAIEQPAETIGLKFQDGIVDSMLQDILGEPAGLPLLQFTLLKLWERRDHNYVTHEIYEQVGGGRLALARSADKFYTGLIPEEQITARRILLRMVRPGEGLEITSSRIRREHLYRGGEDPGRVDRVLAKLIDAHLVRLTKDEEPEDVQIEVAHEALIRNWPTLVDWLDEERTTIRRRRWLEERTAEWKRLGQGDSRLLDVIELRDAENWLASTEAATLGYDPAIPMLVQKSRLLIEKATIEQETARQRELELELERQKSRSRLYIAITLGALTIAMMFAFIIRTQSQVAAQAEAKAKEAQAQATAQASASLATAQAQAIANAAQAQAIATQATALNQAQANAAQAQATAIQAQANLIQANATQENGAQATAVRAQMNAATAQANAALAEANATTAQANDAKIKIISPAEVHASRSAAPSFDVEGNQVTYDPQNAVDGQNATTWRVDGNGNGQWLQLDFTSEVRVQTIGIIPGYDKIDPVDGTDRFTQNRIVKKVRLEFSDGTFLSANLANQRNMQFVPTNGVLTDFVRIVIEETYPPAPNGRNFTPISEIQIQGLR